MYSKNSASQHPEFDARSSKYPENATDGQRLETFSDWAGKVDKYELAEAGFFSIGDEDRTACFHCGIPLRQWESHDVPWVEHARFCPCCEFLIFSKGLPYVKSVLEFYEIRDANFEALQCRHRIEGMNSFVAQETSAARTTATQQAQQPPQIRRRIRNVEPREIRSRLDSDQSKLLLNLGYPRELVGQVIGEQLQTEGNDFGNFGDLVTAVMNAAQMLGIPLHTQR